MSAGSRATPVESLPSLVWRCASFGFAPVGDRYLEDGIDHTEMVLSAEATAAF
jgi:predicted GNAT family N-acyltransferase